MLLRRTFFISASLIASLAVAGTAAQRDKPSPSTATTSETSDKQTVPTASTTPTPTSNPTPSITTGTTLDGAASNTPLTPSPSADVGVLTGLPTLTGGFTIVEPSVPPTQNAPYMQQSTLPEGTVFIVVGAILGFFAVSILAWRMGIAWCLHRSVQRAGQNQGMADTKAIFRATNASAAPFYKYSDRESSVSLPGIGNKGNKKATKSGADQSTASTANLFFSPTAGAAGANHVNGSNRGSSYFPAGFYAAGPGNGTGQSGAPPISLSNLNVQSQNFSRQRSMDFSTPESPHYLNQTFGANDRAPSAYLDNLFNRENAFPLPSHSNYRQNSGA